MTAAERAQRNRILGDLLGWRTVPRQVSTLYGVPGYDVFAPDGTSGGMMVYEVDAGVLYPDFYGSLDAIVEVLAQHDITLRLDFGPAYAARIIPEGRANEPPMPEFCAGNGDYVAEFGHHPTIQELAGVAFAQWVEWLQAQKAEGK